MKLNNGQTFDDVFTKIVNDKLSAQLNTLSSLDKAACMQIYTTIFDSIVEILDNAKIKLTNESVNLIAQFYYDCVTLNSNQHLDPNIFNQRASEKNIETKELLFLFTLFKDCDLVLPIVAEIKLRS